MDADIILYYSCNALVIMRRQRNVSGPDHLFVDVKANFRRGSLKEQFFSTSRAGLQRAGTLFPEPDGGYQPFVHLHDVYLASAIVTALATTESAEFPSLESFRNRRRVQPLVKASAVYDMHGREWGRDMPLSAASRSKALLHATAIFNKLHGCAVEANIYLGGRPMRGKFLSLTPALQGQDIIVDSVLQGRDPNWDLDMYRVRVRGQCKRKFILKIFPFGTFGEVEFRAYVALRELQGSVVPVCCGFGYVAVEGEDDNERPWILVEYVEGRKVPSESLSHAHRYNLRVQFRQYHVLTD
ncbi:uncharacterized protein EV420DRAFT_203780 [Desarmillaria tabescens]|uniref:Protein kinase domain-containing protein n=1 Tax=Armillaria tabescens TaxID=1929756 RepID=A0AA39MK10_ARMTA|nr:uncharacterized protein EV420DRAFT_203780 [Desarmillaria tabescens]KAK0437132.1 hypothetical protein EV420DRAFT_203780 [Desarmillaria tabescens]